MITCDWFCVSPHLKNAIVWKPYIKFFRNVSIVIWIYSINFESYYMFFQLIGIYGVHFERTEKEAFGIDSYPRKQNNNFIKCTIFFLHIFQFQEMKKREYMNINHIGIQSFLFSWYGQKWYRKRSPRKTRKEEEKMYVVKQSLR